MALTRRASLYYHMNNWGTESRRSANTQADFYKFSEDYRQMLALRPEEDFENFLRLVISHVPIGAHVLELGSGTAQAAAILRRTGFNIVASDVSPLFLTGPILKSLPAVSADIGSLPFLDETFDAVVSNEVIEHVTNIGQALFEMARVTRKNGLVIIRAPQLSSPIWPILDLQSLLRGRGRPPHYSDLNSAGGFFLANCKRCIRIGLSSNPVFHWREPDLSGLGGDADATYWASSVELARFLKAHSFHILNRAEVGRMFSRSWFIGILFPWLHTTIAIVARKS